VADAVPQGGVTRRSVLAMGTSLATGIALGLWSCTNEPPVTPTSASKPASKPPIASTTTNPSASASASQSVATTPAATTESATTETAVNPPTPDLGTAVFPNAAGRAIAQPTDAPVIIVPRSDWTTARPKFTQINLMNGISRITVHHTAGEIQTDAWKPTAADLESIREFHAGTRPTDRQWADIAYHFAVDRAGRVWQARPLAYQGAHVRGNNEHNLGIVLLGNFEIQSPSAAQLTALAAFVGFVRKLYDVPLGQVFTHGELVDTSCPGKTLQAYMNRTRAAWAATEGIPWIPLTTRPASSPATGRSGTG